ncbi:hypothetical protein [Acidocella sp.]|uniref:hypothetical protein n=1 Tax=Acidocella sp. TaxID=50710 RepID=UPI0026108186|nr:hypothetical protein [Acidocella sp.]
MPDLRPDGEGVGEVIRPSLGKLLFYMALALGFVAVGVWAMSTRTPRGMIIGVLNIGFFGGLLLMAAYKGMTEGYTLRLRPEGFSIGRRWFSWADAGAGFAVVRTGRKTVRVVRFGPAGQYSLSNIYPLSPEALANLLNGRLVEALGARLLPAEPDGPWPKPEKLCKAAGKRAV